ncbi:MAG: DUF2911 domain-containing protein [Segetibacter sp.]
MKKRIKAVITSIVLLSALQTFSQPTPNISDTAKRAPLASPRDSIATTTADGVTITITYGSPAIKGRTIGKELEPREDSIWRAGANEATTFEVSRDVTIEGKKLPAGKYALFTKKHGNTWTFIFNKTWQTWGAYSYKQNMAQDALQVTVKQMKGSYNERLKYHIDPLGIVHLYWGNIVVGFTVK